MEASRGSFSRIVHGNIFTLGWELTEPHCLKRTGDSLSHATWGGGDGLCASWWRAWREATQQTNATSPPTPLALPLLFNGKDKALCVCSRTRWKTVDLKLQFTWNIKGRTEVHRSAAPRPHALREEACVRAPVNTPVHARTHLLKRVRVHSTWLFATLARSLGPVTLGSLLSGPLLDPAHLVFFHPLTGDKWPQIPCLLKASFFFYPFVPRCTTLSDAAHVYKCCQSWMPFWGHNGRFLGARVYC